MQWSEVVKPPPAKMLRQFAGLCLIVFLALAGWRAWRGNTGTLTSVLAAFGLVVGGVGLIWPAAVRWVFTAWMIVAFPIGWTISRLMLLLLFYLMFTPMAFIFRLQGRDALRLRARTGASGSYWQPKPRPGKAADYFRQS